VLLTHSLLYSHFLLIIATFGGLFDFPDLSDGQSELSSPPNSSDSDESAYSKATEDEKDA
jgi:hypothetical protein